MVHCEGVSGMVTIYNFRCNCKHGLEPAFR